MVILLKKKYILYFRFSIAYLFHSYKLASKCSVIEYADFTILMIYEYIKKYTHSYTHRSLHVMLYEPKIFHSQYKKKFRPLIFKR